MRGRRRQARWWTAGAAVLAAVASGCEHRTDVGSRTAPAAGVAAGSTGGRDSMRTASRTRIPARSRSSGSCIVESVTDGDTMRCVDGRRIRLLLIDAPERTQPPFGERSRDALRKLAPRGTRLRVELDVRPTDRYDRTLAYLWRADGRMLNHEMVRGGWAVVLVYPPNVRHVDRLRAAADSAKRERRGLYEVGGFECTPVEHRRRTC